MLLTQLIYISRSSGNMTAADIRALATHSANKNRLADISGALLSVGPHFMQVLEGDMAVITNLFERIRLDPRHTDVHCLITKTISRRLYPEWGMRLFDPESRAKLDLVRINRLIKEFRVHRTTGTHSVEARVLVDDFQRQLSQAA
ncbi:hypothetical protein BH10PLA1_BH10PLA1_12930 [soil metagenome]